MTRKRRRLYLLLSGMAVLALAAGLVLTAFQDSLVFFVSPSDLKAGKAPAGRSLRLGGLVEPGSVARLADGVSVTFRVTDNAEAVPVRYSGILPDLFREGQGVVVEGRMNADGSFAADEVLAKHDETYMPREVVEALKQSGEWRGAGQEAKP
ncbi:MAG: cytochrome c maturation protein CcmE [Kiloniellales bacterium]